VETHDEGELRRALAVGASLIGINNRNLDTFVVDLGVTERLAAAAPGRFLVAEKRHPSTRDVERGCNARERGRFWSENRSCARRAESRQDGRVDRCQQ